MVSQTLNLLGQVLPEMSLSNEFAAFVVIPVFFCFFVAKAILDKDQISERNFNGGDDYDTNLRLSLILRKVYYSESLQHTIEKAFKIVQSRGMYDSDIPQLLPEDISCYNFDKGIYNNINISSLLYYAI